MQQNVELAKRVLKYLRKNIEMTIKRDSNLKYQVKKLSKAVKLCHYLLTSPELGYKNVMLEHYFDNNKSVDFYISDIDLSIELEGPAHFYANTGERIESL